MTGDSAKAYREADSALNFALRSVRAMACWYVVRHGLLVAILLVGCGEPVGDAPADGGVPDADPGQDARSPADAAPEDASGDAGFEAEAGQPEDGGRMIPETMQVLVGSGRWGGAEGRITSYRFDPADGSLVRTASTAAGNLASFLAFDAVRRVVHMADEGGGRILSFAMGEEGRLTLLDQRTARGNPVYVRLDADRAHLLAAHYGEGRTEVFRIQANGAVGEATDLASSGAQSHAVELSPDGRFAFVPAKGEDWIAQYRYQAGGLTENTPAQAATDPGAGPRHLAFHPDGDHAYVIDELGNTVTVLAYDAAAGTLAKEQTVSALPAGFSGDATGAEVHIHPNGRFLYATERVDGGDGLIAIFAVGDDGALAPIAHESTRGQVPRHFTLTPDGGHLLAANRTTGNIAVFAVDADTGTLSFLGTEDVGDTPFFVGVFVAR